MRVHLAHGDREKLALFFAATILRLGDGSEPVCCESEDLISLDPSLCIPPTR